MRLLSLILPLLTLGCLDTPSSSSTLDLSESFSNAQNQAPCGQKVARHALGTAITSDTFSELDPLTTQYGIGRNKAMESGNPEHGQYAVEVIATGIEATQSSSYLFVVESQGSGCMIKSYRLLTIPESDRFFRPANSFTQGKNKDDKQGIGRD